MIRRKEGLELKIGPRTEQISDTTPSYSNRPKIRIRQPAGLSQAIPPPSALRDDHSHEAGPEATERPQNLDFNPALYTVKAFGIATFAVTLGAVTFVWGVKNAMGIEDTQEFARRMHQLILTRMPILSSRIHRSLEDDPRNDETLKSDVDDWNWDDAEKRLKNAFEQKGLAGWAEVALDEIRAEEHVERKKRIALEENTKR
ncbi:hypothetical protein Moror_3177 [Moniliophthora roreri MCA 2997]|uniref:Uncharacterized protein n=1 Tax=Moniliophthora roreri (strain MCA 2997) TaxID=1381753 RepID=V2YA39_MONRO|nr:hypothetical protein Moror_3177 [Moniliophthora roreri MCA 2997]